jgi:hypothetical protein
MVEIENLRLRDVLMFDPELKLMLDDFFRRRGKGSEYLDMPLTEFLQVMIDEGMRIVGKMMEDIARLVASRRKKS